MDLRVFVEPQQGASYDDQLRVAKAAEDLGFDAFFRSDHYLAMGVEGMPGPTESWSVLAGIARETSRVRLGTMLSSATFRLPGPLAVTVAQVDAMSGGRVELGLGAGWFEAEHLAYGIPFPPVGERFDRLEEQLQIISGLWETPDGKTYDFTGTHYALRDSPALPKPVQSPRPPIIVGGHGPKRTPRLAATYADEFNVAFSPPAEAYDQLDRVRAACDEQGRDRATLRMSLAQVLCCGRDDTEVRRRADAIGKPVERVRSGELGGTPAELVERIGDYAAHGVQRVYLQTLDLTDLDHLELVASEVMPQL